VKAGTTTNGGSSWDDAFADIQTAITAIGSRLGRIEIWVSEGTQPGFKVTRSETSVYGGFSSTGYPNSVAGRDLTTKETRIRPKDTSAVIVINSDGITGICRNLIIDGMRIYSDTTRAITISHAENTILSNFRIEKSYDNSGDGFVNIRAADVVLEKVFIRDNNSGNGSMWVSEKSRVSILNSEITNNFAGNYYFCAGINILGGAFVKIRNSKLYRNKVEYFGSNNYYQGGIFHYSSNEKFDIDFCIV
jgi:hypothetical protein